MKQRLRSKMIPLQHGHHRTFLGGHIFQRKNTPLSSTHWSSQVPTIVRRIVKLSATPLRNRPHMVFCSQGTS